MPQRRRLSAGLLLALAIALPIAAQKSVPPAPSEFVLDEPDWLSRLQESRLAAQLAQYERESSNQILVAIFQSLDGEDLAEFSQRVAQSWGIGQGERNNGILLAVYADDRQFDIEVGYGLEGAVTDLIAAQILDQRLRPAFRAGRYDEGLTLAITDLIAASRGEYQGSGRSNADAERRRSRDNPIPFFVILLLIALFGGRRARRNYLGAYLLGSALGQLGGTRRGGGFGGGGGGFGGGGFRGGGGSFGGGGARGGW